MSKFYNVQPETLKTISAAILNKNGIPERESKVVAASLVDADLKGVSSHGVLRLAIYLKRLGNKVIHPNPEFEVIKETNSTVVLDGGNGLGQVVSQYAVDLLKVKAQQSPISAVTVRNSNHFGAAAYWAAQLTDNDMIGIVMSNVEPLMPPPGGASAKIGNNPISFAVPAGDHYPIVLDMATSSVPLGKILNAKSKGESIPEGWGLNHLGQSTTDPDEVVNGGSLFPVGGPKGYGLAVMVDVLTALLSNGAFSDQIHSMYNDLDKPNSISHFFMAIRIDAFSDPSFFKQIVDQYITSIKSTPLAQGANAIFMPGEIEFLNKEKNEQNGIQLPESVVKELVQLAEQAGVDVSELTGTTAVQNN
jgi:ureidoglycolate dehydrogenase (NAD+)